MGASCDYVTEENREAWLRFVENKIREVMKPETMDTQEFKECLMYVEEEKRKRKEYSRREEELRIKHADEGGEQVLITDERLFTHYIFSAVFIKLRKFLMIELITDY